MAELDESGKEQREATVSVQNRACELITHDPGTGIAYRETPPDRAVLLCLLDQLLTFERMTNPHGHFPRMAFKDVTSRDVLRKAGTLVASLVRWAVMHQAGLALSGTPASVYPWIRPDPPSDLPPEMEQASDPQHEIRGATWSGTDPTPLRSALATVIEAVLGFWEPARELARALRALDMGEVQPILEPASTRRHGAAYTLADLRLQALAQVQFLQGYRGRAGDAVTKVAEALGERPDTLRATYPRRLRVGEPMNRYLLETARFMGEELQRLSMLSSPTARDEQRRAWILEHFGDGALAELATAYRKAKASIGSKSCRH